MNEPQVTFSFPNTGEYKFDIECHHKALAFNALLGAALDMIRTRLKYSDDVTDKDEETLSQIRAILVEVYVEG